MILEKESLLPLSQGRAVSSFPESMKSSQERTFQKIHPEVGRSEKLQTATTQSSISDSPGLRGSTAHLNKLKEFWIGVLWKDETKVGMFVRHVSLLETEHHQHLRAAVGTVVEE